MRKATRHFLVANHFIRLIDTMDPLLVGTAMTMSGYSIRLAADFLEKYKFRNWINHSATGIAVTQDEKRARSLEIAARLCNNDHWKSHGHGISRDVVETDLRIKIDRTETNPDLERALRRFWALLYWVFDNSEVVKLFLSQNYVLIRSRQKQS